MSQLSMVRKRLSRKTQIVMDAIVDMEALAKYGPVDRKWLKSINEAVTSQLSSTLKVLEEGREDEEFTLTDKEE